MKLKTIKKAGWITGYLIAVVIFTLACAGSWFMTCGIVKLITLCFDWTFTWGLGSGVWLIMLLIRYVFSMGEIKVRK